MSLDLTIYDDTALEALAPKGVVRRARRDFEAALAVVKERDAIAAVVDAVGETVRIDARGPKAAQCTCAATGVCRHVLLAVMALNAEAPASGEEQEEPAGASAIEELAALSQAEIQAFAGADWTTAVSLAASSAGSIVREAGRNCTVEIEGAPASVTFLAGLGLKGAAFKGPKTRARPVVTAAALIVRAKQGVAFDLPTEDETPLAGVSQDYLGDAAHKLLESTRMVMSGASPVAADTLFDLAISARAEAAPRLASLLRALTKQAGQGANRLVQFEPETFLAEAARTYALIEALRRNPTDADLTGVIRRDYQLGPSMDLWVLGAVRWSTETGARGLTLHGFEPRGRQWRTVVQARGPGMDPSFDPRMAFSMPLWGAASAKALVGRIVHLPSPLVSADGAIAPTVDPTSTVGDAIPRARTLIEGDVAFSVWSHLRADVSARRGTGLHRRATPLPALLAPTKFGPLSFDDFTQSYKFAAIDKYGDAISLTMSADSYLDAKRLSQTARPPLLLAETTEDLDRPALRPVAILHDAVQATEVINLTLDVWTVAPRNAIDVLQDLLPRKVPAGRLTRDPLAELARRALAEAAAVCAGEAPHMLSQLEQSCDAAGLAALSQALRRMDVERSTARAMATAYLASETLSHLSWA